MLIYCPAINPRIEYTIDHVFSNNLGLDTSITSSIDDFKDYKGPKLSYSPENPAGNSHWIWSGGLLSDEGVKPIQTGYDDQISWDGLPMIFMAPEGGIIPFDILSAVFYFLSRYEEHLSFDPDTHGRFPSGASLANQMAVLDKPIVDLWINRLGKQLEKIFQNKIKIKDHPFKFDSTIDIDNAWAFRHKGFSRTLGAIFRGGQGMETRNFRYQVLRGKQEDPYFQYPKMDMIHDEYGVSPKYFFLVGQYGRFDRNINPGKKAFRKLIREIAEHNYTGLHPSYGSDSRHMAIRKEKEILEEIIGKEVDSSRQHYLRLKFPSTYRSLIKAGIKYDFTMGFADNSGFRAGTSRPFRFFDIEYNKATGLIVKPFQVMDTGLRDYESLSPEKAVQKISQLIHNTREAGGTFRSLWHNESFSDWAGWEGWTNVYLKMLKMAKGEQ